MGMKVYEERDDSIVGEDVGLGFLYPSYPPEPPHTKNVIV